MVSRPPPGRAPLVATLVVALVVALTVGPVVGLLPGPPAGAASDGQAAEPPRPWVWPLQPAPSIVHPFVAPVGPYGPGHRGVDLAGSVGQPVLAVASGRVNFAGSVAGRGVVVVDHGRLRTTYEPVLVSATAGQRVRRGGVLGTVLGTLTLAGGHCLPLACLHLGVRDGATYLDPLDFLGGGPIRLLPLDGSTPVACCAAPRGVEMPVVWSPFA